MEEEDRDSFQEVYSRYTQYDWPFDEKIQIYSHCRKKFRTSIIVDKNSAIELKTYFCPTGSFPAA